MAYCQGCGEYVGDYSGYRRYVSGKGEVFLCYKCNRWADRNPGRSNFPSRKPVTPEMNRVRTFANIYILISLGVFVLGGILILMTNRVVAGILLFAGALSLFLFGRGMKRFLRK